MEKQIPVEAFLQQPHTDALLRTASEPDVRGGGGGVKITDVREEEDDVRQLSVGVSQEKNQSAALLFAAGGAHTTQISRSRLLSSTSLTP